MVRITLPSGRINEYMNSSRTPADTKSTVNSSTVEESTVIPAIQSLKAMVFRNSSVPVRGSPETPPSRKGEVTVAPDIPETRT